MNAYPIGNDLTVKWSLLYSDGSVFPLSNYDYELSYRTNRGNKVVTDTSVISVDENILTWTFKGDEQAVSGRYTICLKITLSGSKVVELQYDNAFMLSPLSGFKGAGSEIVLQSYCDAIDLKDAVLQARKAMDIAAGSKDDAAISAAAAKAAKEAAEVTAAKAKTDAESAKTMAADAKDKVAVAENAATNASRDAVAARQAAQAASDHITSLEQAISELPDGQAVSEKVAEHTTKLAELRREIGKFVIPTTENNKYINLSGGIGTIAPVTSPSTSTTGYRYMLQPCQRGDIVIINGIGGSSPRLWAFLDSDFRILSVAKGAITETDLEKVAPLNSAFVLINDSSGSNSYMIKADSLTAKLDSLSMKGEDTYTYTGAYESHTPSRVIPAGIYIRNKGDVGLYVYSEDDTYKILRVGETILLHKEVSYLKSFNAGYSVVQYFSEFNNLANDVSELEVRTFGELIDSASNSFLPDNQYPQFNRTINASPQENIFIRSDSKILSVYEMYSDGTYLEIPFGKSMGEVMLSDNFEGNIRILFSRFVEETTVSVAIYKSKGAINEVLEENAKLKSALNEAVAMIDGDYPPMYSAMIFNRVGCIGDSYTAGHIQLNGGVAHSSNPRYSYPYYMGKLTGQIYTNFGLGGSTAKDWIVSVFDRMGIAQNGNKCQAYIIGLGINDSGTWSPTATEPGSATDIGTDNDTYTAYYYKLVQRILGVNPQAKIFCNTEPRFQNNGYNAAVRNIVEYCRDHGQDVFLCDLAKYYNSGYYRNPVFLQDSVNGHFTAIGYQFMAECYLRIMSKVIKDNIQAFQNVFEIPYDEYAG